MKKTKRIFWALCLWFGLAGADSLHAAAWTNLTTLSVSANAYYALAVRSDGSVWGWGLNRYGELGALPTSLPSSAVPHRIDGFTNAVAVAAGGRHALALLSDGRVFAWGTNDLGQLGNGTTTYSASPVQVLGLSNAIAIAAGGYHSMAILADGTAKTWGDNQQGQLGNANVASFTNAPAPLSNTNIVGVTAIAAGTFHSLFLTSTGAVWSVGLNDASQLGDGNNSSQEAGNNRPNQVTNMAGAVAIAAGRNQSMAVKGDGTLWVWGGNFNGELGIGTTSGEYPVPFQLAGMSNMVSVAASIGNSLALDGFGNVFVWGYNGFAGQPLIPVQLAYLPPIKTLCQAYLHSLAMGYDGSLYAWGWNGYGQFGDDSYTASVGGLAARYRTGPYPTAQPGQLSRGNLDVPMFTSFVIPLTQQQGVRIDAAATDSYKFGLMTPWLDQLQTNSVNQVQAVTSGTVGRIAVQYPVAAFGTDLGGTPLYPGQNYSFGVYAGGLDETSATATNAFTILVYNRNQFGNGTNGIQPIATNVIVIPRRTVAADATAWSNFVANSFRSTNSAFGLTTTVEFVQAETNAGYTSWGLYWQGSVLPQFQLCGYKITHSASAAATNYHFVVEGLGSIQTGTSTRAPFAVDGSGSWVSAPLYSLDFTTHPPLRALFVDQPQFNGVPLPPTYAGGSPQELAGMVATITNNIWITNNPAFTNIDNSPELRQHPLLDQLVSQLNNDPLKLASYVQNEIALVDPIGVSGTNYSNVITVNQGGVNRSALGTYLEGRGSPAEQCALLVYLLRKAGYPAAYVWPTNNNILMLQPRLSALLRMQIQRAPDTTGQPIVNTALVPVQYPWVVVNVGGQSYQIFPWLKDTQITTGLNPYDYLPAGYNSGYLWVSNYLRGDTNILSLDSRNTPLVLFPEFLTQALESDAPGISIDDMGTIAFDRRVEYARWQDLPLPNVLQNQSQVVISTNLSDNFGFLSNIFGTLRVQVYAGTTTNGSAVLDTGSLRMADLNDRKFLLLTNNSSTLELWLAPYRSGVSSTLQFTNDSSLLNTQRLTCALGGQNNYMVLLTQNSQPAAVTNWSGFVGIDPPFQAQYGPFSYNAASLAAITINLGQVTRPMQRPYSDLYSQLQSQMAANTNWVPSVEDYQGSVAYLLGLNYFSRESSFTQAAAQWHSIQTLSENEAGLAKLTRDSTGTNVQSELDMETGFLLGAPYGGSPSGTTELNIREDPTTSWENFMWLYVAGASAEEHETINLTMGQTTAISAVRLLQLAQARATNGNTGILELTRSNYAAIGGTTQSGWGSTQVQNQDTAIWAAVTNAFTNWDGDFLRVFLTPGTVTNETGNLKGVGALFVGQGDAPWAAYITGQSTPIHGADGEYWYDFDPPFVDPYVPVDGPGSYTISEEPWGYSFGIDLSFFNPPAQPANTPPTDTPTDAYVQNPINVMDAAASTPATGQNILPPSLTAAAVQIIQIQMAPNSDAQGWAAITALQTGADQGNAGPPDDHETLWSTVMDPVNVISGEFYVDAVDLALPGPMPLQVRRNYEAQNLSYQNGLGYGWKLNVVPYLTMVTNTNSVVFAYAAETDGSVIVYRLQTNGLYTVTPQDNPMLNNQSRLGIGSTANRFNNSIQQSTNSGVVYYTLRGADGSQRAFQQQSFPLTNGTTVLNRTRPYLNTWQDHRGNVLTFSYGTNAAADDYGQMNRIQSGNGDFLVFDYDTYKRVADAYTGDGQRVVYEYDEFGDLVTVTLPDQSQINYTYQHSPYTVTNGTAISSHVDSDHLLTFEKKPGGRILENVYDGQRRVTAQLATVGQDMNLYTNAQFIYSNQLDDTNNPLTSSITGKTLVLDIFGNTNAYQYSAGLITNITDPLNFSISQSWWPTNATAPGYPRSLKQTIDQRGLMTLCSYDNLGNVTNTAVLAYATNAVAGLVPDLTGDGTFSLTNQAVYSTNNVPLLIVDPLGNQLQCVYATNDPYLPAQIIRLAGSTPVATNLFSYVNVTNVTSDGVHGVTNRAFGLLQKVVRAGTATNIVNYDGRGFPTSQIQYPATADYASPDPAVTNYFFFNDRNLLELTTNALGWSMFLTYDPVGRPETREVRDQTGRVLAADAQYYNANGEMNWYDGPQSNPDDYVWRDFDGAGRLTTEVRWHSRARADGSGVEAETGDDLYSMTFHSYDGYGNETNTVDPLGNYCRSQYDARGQKTNEVFYAANSTALATNRFTYEPGGQAAITFNALGAGTTNIYNVAGRLVGRLNADGSTNAWRYDLSGRVIKEILANGNYWQTAYNDPAKSITRTFHNATNTLATNVTQFDNRGNAVKFTDEGGNLFTNLFDGLDRIKVAAGPATASVSIPGINPASTNVVTNIVQQVSTYIYDAYGQSLTISNALGERTAITSDVLGRATQVAVYASNGVTPLRFVAAGYNANNNSITVTNGTGAGAIVTTTYADTEGRPLLTVHYPTNGVLEYELTGYDRVGNPIARQQASIKGTQITVWATNGWTYDGLNRVLTQTGLDGATTTFNRDALGDVTNCTMPNSLTWSASYLNDGRISSEQESGGVLTTRSMTYQYFAAGSPFAGLLQVLTDGRGTTRTNNYDDFLRLAAVNTGGSLPEQQTSATLQYNSRSLLTSVAQSFSNPNTGFPTSVSRNFDGYGQILSETASIGIDVIYSSTQGWDSAGRRVLLNKMPFGYQADGAMTSVGSATFSYGDNGLLNARSNSSRVYTIGQRDGRGRILQTTTTVGLSTALTENLAWRNDGRLTGYTANRGDFNDARTYAYSAFARRLTNETFNIGAGQSVTNSYAIDNGNSGGLGILTSKTVAGAASATWTAPVSGGLDGLNRVAKAQNSVLSRPAYGLALGAGSVSATLDGKPVSVDYDTSEGGALWRADLDLLAGTSHTLKVSAVDSTGAYFGYATNTFITATNSGDVITNTFDGNGNVTTKVWINALGQTNRTQTFTFDAFDRLIGVVDRDSVSNGFNWTATFDGLGRRLSTGYTMVVSNTPIVDPPDAASTIDSTYDPEVEFLETSVTVNGFTTMKSYGPDASGTYGGMQGAGGLESTKQKGFLTSLGAVQDYFGNVIGTVSNTIVLWNPTRFSSYGPAPGFQSPALSLDTGLAASLGWSGKRVDETGLIYLGARHYDPLAGRFMSADPLGHEGSLDLYSFCGSDPVNFVDPDGRLAKQELQSAYNGGIQGAVLHAAANWLTSYADNSQNPVVGPSAASGGQLLNEVAAMSTPSTYVDGATQFGSTVDTLYHEDGLSVAGSYALTSWNVGAVVSGFNNVNLATGQPVGDWFQRGQLISSGVGNTAGIASFGLGIAKPFVPGAGVPPVIRPKGPPAGTPPAGAGAGSETFYRAMSESEYASLVKNKGLSVRPKGSSQLFVTQDSTYLRDLASRPAQTGKYPLAVKFSVAQGTRQSLIDLGATHPSAAGLFPDLPEFRSGMDAVQLKLEAGGVPAYGLGSSPTGLQIFNSSIQSFDVIKPIGE